jgi:hypothetical protein
LRVSISAQDTGFPDRASGRAPGVTMQAGCTRQLRPRHTAAAHVRARAAGRALSGPPPHGAARAAAPAPWGVAAPHQVPAPPRRRPRLLPRAAQQHQETPATAAAPLDGAGVPPVVAALREPAPGGVVTTSGAVRLAASQPAYQVHITYCSRGRLLEPCDRIWAHAGHSGWSNT